MQGDFKYSDERFADLQLLRYRLKGFESLSVRQKALVYYLAKATLAGRDITTDQGGRYNLRIRKLLETVYCEYKGDRKKEDFKALEIYLKRIWFSNGIYHHYGCEKFTPGFTESFLREAIQKIDPGKFSLEEGESIDDLCRDLFPVIFDPLVLPKRVNQADGEDLVLTSSCNFYEGVTQKEVEDFYEAKRLAYPSVDRAPSFGLNSRLVKENGIVKEQVYTTNGLYAKALKQIVYWLEKAAEVAENEQQRKVIKLLIEYYHSGDLQIFDEYSIEWLKEQNGEIDFINGFIEVYGDPLGLKGIWEGLVEYEDKEATKRTRLISEHAQWFEDHSPVDRRFKKDKVRGVTARVICAAMLGGDEYPSSAIGINLPNAEWIRAQYGSKSITIGNLTEAYNKAALGNGFREEFVIPNAEILECIRQYSDMCDDLHTDFHECVGHGSGQLLPHTSPDALKAYGSTIEEARADLFGLYYIADEKLVELHLLPSADAYKSQHYTYMMNGLLTQLVRIKPGHEIEEAHMRNRSLIAHWTMDLDRENVRIITQGGKSYVQIKDFRSLRTTFAKELAEIQRIKSEGDYSAARELVEKYAVKVNSKLHEEVLSRYKALDIAPFKGFINPSMTPIVDEKGNITDI
ncbi:MAG: dihydrofolate reductase [Prevotella sp.]